MLEMKDVILLYCNICDTCTGNDNGNYAQCRLINYLSLIVLVFEQLCPIP